MLEIRIHISSHLGNKKQSQGLDKMAGEQRSCRASAGNWFGTGEKQKSVPVQSAMSFGNVYFWRFLFHLAQENRNRHNICIASPTLGYQNAIKDIKIAGCS